MSSLLVIVIPLALTIIGIMWLNGFNIVHDQPEYSLEANPVDKLAARELGHGGQSWPCQGASWHRAENFELNRKEPSRGMQRSQDHGRA